MRRIVSAGVPSERFAGTILDIHCSMPRAHLSPAEFTPGGARKMMSFRPRVALTLFGQPLAKICLPFRELRDQLPRHANEPQSTKFIGAKHLFREVVRSPRDKLFFLLCLPQTAIQRYGVHRPPRYLGGYRGVATRNGTSLRRLTGERH